MSTSANKTKSFLAAVRVITNNQLFMSSVQLFDISTPIQRLDTSAEGERLYSPPTAATERTLHQSVHRTGKPVPLLANSTKPRGGTTSHRWPSNPECSPRLSVARTRLRHRNAPGDKHFAAPCCRGCLLTHRQSGAPHFHSRCSVRGPLHLLSPASVLSHSHPPSSTRK